MAEQIPQGHANNSTVDVEEPKQRGCLDFMTNKDEKSTEDLVMMDGAGKEGKHTLMDELQRTHTHSSSSSEEEVDEGGERKKKKKGLKEAIKEKINGDKPGEETEPKQTPCVPMEKCNEEENAEMGCPEEKKGFLEKIKEKLPGQHKKGAEETQATAPAACEHSPGSDPKEKKGIIDMIKEKLPRHHKNNENEVQK